MAYRPDLPAFYYHDHFNEMVGFVMTMYGDILGPEEKDFIDSFRGLDHEAQCVFIRLCNRKKAVFHRRDLGYAEILDIDGAIDTLMTAGYLKTLDAGDYAALLETLPKPALTLLAEKAGLPSWKNGWKKNRMVDEIRSAVPFDRFNDLHGIAGYFLPCRRQDVMFLLFLYFGKMNDSLTSFALRDLGIVPVSDRDAYNARFDDLEEARSGFFYSQAIKRLKTGRAEEYQRLSEHCQTFPAAASAYTAELKNSLLHMLGYHHEKEKNHDTAIALYRQSDAFACRERLVRLYYALDRRIEAEALLDKMMTDPSSDEEHIFAADFQARKTGKQRIGIYTGLLRDAQEITIDEIFRGTPEFAAVRHFKRKGWTAFHAENTLWRMLFGLVFWDELFEREKSLSSGFDRVSHLLRKKTFHTVFNTEIKKKLTRVRAGQAAESVLATYQERQGTPNGIFPWYEEFRPLIATLLSCDQAAAVAVILEKMALDYHGMRDGFPDLMLVQGNAVRFVEIKAEGDQLRRHQLARLQQLRQAGFDADICRVAYHVDPEQVYVVVDIETTGGRAPSDRITEIGAVKMQNGRVLAEWQSLINPERRIPHYITELTGISDAMVEDAPVFAAIADDFESFMEGAVFVAHNVNFDYGFIASEYRRLDRVFRYPKLCTCAGMRRHYPGHESYSLASLCTAYRINLVGHHRALNDARAAAQLLALINEKRCQAPQADLQKTA